MNSPTTKPDEETLWTLEAWRGVAAWMVVYAHYQVFAGVDVPVMRFTYTGVDLFFVLSGFVFAPYLFGRPLATGAFAVRRFFRIYPAYLVALAVYIVMRALSGQDLAYWWQHVVFAHLQSRTMAFYYNPAFWSLPSEVEFYIVLPMLAVFTRGRPGRFLALTSAALLLRLLLGHASDSALENRAYIWMYHLPGMLIEFLLGGCAWLLSRTLRSRPARAVLLAGGVAGWLTLAIAFATLGDAGIDASWARGQISWMAALAFASMVAATAQPPSRSMGRLVPVAVWAGRLSYGTYLLHFAAMRLLEPYAKTLGSGQAALAACVLTVTAAWVLYQLWENPWRKLGRSLAKRFYWSPHPPGQANR